MKMLKVHQLDFRRQAIARMEDITWQKTWLLPLTLTEKRWLREAIARQEACLFLDEKTLASLREWLMDVENERTDIIVEKQAVRKDVLQMPHRAQMERMAQAIVNRTVMMVSMDDQQMRIIPLRIEYNRATHEWSLVYAMAQFGADHRFATCPITTITEAIDTEERLSVASFSAIREAYDAEFIQVELFVSAAVIAAEQDGNIKEHYHRLLYAFSQYDRELEQLSDGSLHIHLQYRPVEERELLQKILMLGKKVAVKQPAVLRQRWLDEVERSLAMYGGV
jgi:hypothetical protein